MIKIEQNLQDKELIRNLVSKIRNYNGEQIRIMEVCGSHTMAISKFGIRSILPNNILLLSGPGCPVCVTPSYFIQAAIALAKRTDVIITTFGDMMRVPYEGNSLLLEKARGRDIRIVYSPLDNLEIASQNPDKKIIFLSVGFETTIPVIALSVLEACRYGIHNYMLLTANKTIPEVMKLLLSEKDLAIDGFLYPGHVSAIIGTKFYEEIAEVYKITGVVAGFEPLDLLGAIYKTIENIRKDNAIVENLYSRVVLREGNMIAREKMYEVFEESDAIWRGLGLIPLSGLSLKRKYEEFDAWKQYQIEQVKEDIEPVGCICGDILKGKCQPHDCKLFGKRCTPENPIGACMVSSEGTCAAYFKYQC